MRTRKTGLSQTKLKSIVVKRPYIHNKPHEKKINMEMHDPNLPKEVRYYISSFIHFF
jgi:hypothetical protein